MPSGGRQAGRLRSKPSKGTEDATVTGATGEEDKTDETSGTEDIKREGSTKRGGSEKLTEVEETGEAETAIGTRASSVIEGSEG
jgi:hypothetical protein